MPSRRLAAVIKTALGVGIKNNQRVGYKKKRSGPTLKGLKDSPACCPKQHVSLIDANNENAEGVAKRKVIAVRREEACGRQAGARASTQPCKHARTRFSGKGESGCGVKQGLGAGFRSGSRPSSGRHGF